MATFEIRAMTLQDADAAATVWLCSRRAAIEHISAPIHSDAEVRSWVSSHLLVELECWIAETPSGEVVGLLVLERDWIEQLYVLPARQGRGVGSGLVELAKRLRPRGLQLWTFVSNTPARRLYEGHGFLAVEQTDGAHNEERAPDVRYVYEPDELQDS